MEATYKWEVEAVIAKPTFKDKHNNIRQNVVKTVNLIYKGEKGTETRSVRKIINFNITDLSTFTDASLLTKEQILEWCFNEMNPKEKLLIENQVHHQLENAPLDAPVTILLEI